MAARPLMLACLLLLAGCAGGPPRQPDDLCAVFAEKRGWYKASREAERRWGAPIAIPMAILHQESGFRADARPPRRWLLGFIPLGRPSDAYGFPQAKSPAWKDYRRESGNGWAERDDFADAVDFVQWYIDRSHRLNGTAKTDAYALYLNYHEGWGGYRRGSWRGKPGVQAVARKVDARAKRYAAQYAGCRQELERGWFSRLLPG